MGITLGKLVLDMQFSEIEIVKYSAQRKSEWNDFIVKSKNAFFLFNRNYMDYHSDRFTDHSLIVYQSNKIIALFPANELGDKIYSHQGLTYGGVLLLPETTLLETIEILKSIVEYYRKLNFKSFIYKAIPQFYHKNPACEDLYALSLMGAKLARRNASAVIDLKNRISYAKGRKSQISKAKKHQFTIERSVDYKGYMSLVQERLREKYDTTSTHTAEEIIYLNSLFPENIKLFTCKESNLVHAGIIVFETERVVHCQYIGTSNFGREVGALDLLTDFLINKEFSTKSYFDFGTSADFSEFGINIGLHKNKESYGARSVICDIYEMELNA